MKKKDSLLSRILGTAPEASTEALESLQAEFDAFKTQANELVAAGEKQLAEANAKLAETAEALAEAALKIEELQASLDAAQADEAKAAAEAASQRLAMRKEKIIAAVGTDQVDQMMAVTEKLEDEQFNAVLAAFGVREQMEAANPLFNEVGAAGEADLSKVDETPEMKALKAKYHGAKA